MNYFVSPTKTASVSQPINGLYVGKVSRVVDGQVFVEVPAILNGFSFGPAIVSNFTATPAVNDLVACGFLNNSLDEIIIMGKLADVAPAVEAFGTPKPTQATQLGSRITSTSSTSYFGYGMALSRDGKRIAVGEHLDDTAAGNGGRAQIFEYIDGEWTQIGSDILGTTSNMQLGKAVALNGDGSVMAVSGEDAANSYIGVVRIADYVGGSWVERPSLTANVTNSYFGNSLALSSDGSRIAVGASQDSTAAASAGAVYVYDWDGSAWAKVGITFFGVDAVDFVGSDVALSPDGNRLVIGAALDDVGSVIDAGSVAVYDWDGSSWNQVGSLVSGVVNDHEIGRSVALSADGQTFITGSPTSPTSGTGEVLVYSWNGSDWEQKGLSLVGNEHQDKMGEDVAISSDGSRIAVGVWGASVPARSGGDVSCGAVRVYDWNGASWVQVGGDFHGQINHFFGWRTGMSDDGLVIAGSAWGNASYEVRAFGFY